MNRDLPEDFAPVIGSQLKAWTAELELLLEDPRVRKFTELRQKIDEADAIIEEANAPLLSNRSSPFDPYDAYDAFEFARDFVGREISTSELSELALGRFPDMSNESRGLMMLFLISNGAAVVVRRTTSGHPTWYRFVEPREKGTRKRLGIPDNELSAFKMEDLAAPVRAAGLIRP